MLFALTAAAVGFGYVAGCVLLALVSVALGEPSQGQASKDVRYVGPIDIERGHHVDIIA